MTFYVKRESSSFNESIKHSDEELQHHGVLGQKWGIRRYQNYDGTLTDAGKEHLSNNDSKQRKKKIITGVAIGLGVAAVAAGAMYLKNKTGLKLSDLRDIKNVKLDNAFKENLGKALNRGLSDMQEGMDRRTENRKFVSSYREDMGAIRKFADSLSGGDYGLTAEQSSRRDRQKRILSSAIGEVRNGIRSKGRDIFDMGFSDKELHSMHNDGMIDNAIWDTYYVPSFLQKKVI